MCLTCERPASSISSAIAIALVTVVSQKKIIYIYIHIYPTITIFLPLHRFRRLFVGKRVHINRYACINVCICSYIFIHTNIYFPSNTSHIQPNYGEHLLAQSHTFIAEVSHKAPAKSRKQKKKINIHSFSFLLIRDCKCI